MWLIEILAEAFVTYVLDIPGALVRWLFNGCKGRFSEVWMDDSSWNSFIGFVVLTAAVVVYNLISS